MMSRGLIFVAVAIVAVVCEKEVMVNPGDSKPVKEVRWTARVVTSDKFLAGTNADIFIQITGNGGRSREVHLDNNDDNFERGDVDKFSFSTKYIGEPTSLRVWHDDSGAGSGWHLERIELMSETGEPGTYVFNCDCWLALDEHDRNIQRILPVSSMHWKAWVHTGNNASAGTDSRVWIVIFGYRGSTRQIPLRYARDDFEKGHANSFTFNTVEIGIPVKIRVITEEGDDWHLDKIELEDLNGKAKYTFGCDCWLGKSGQTVKDIRSAKV